MNWTGFHAGTLIALQSIQTPITARLAKNFSQATKATLQSFHSDWRKVDGGFPYKADDLFRSSLPGGNRQPVQAEGF